MSFLTWLGIVPLGVHRELQRRHGELELAYDKVRREADDLRRRLDLAESEIGVAIASRTEVSKMLRQAMDDVTSAVGLVQILDAAKRKLEMGTGALNSDEIEAHAVGVAQPADEGVHLTGSSDER